VVALGGSNNLGKCVVVKNVFSPRPLPFPEMPLTINRNTGPLNILIAAGPFTPSDSLSFEAFDDLLEKIKEVKPGVCILLGPFLDENHQKLDEFVDNQENTFEAFFRNKVQELCSLGLTGTQFVLVSSSRDVHHLPVYPTPPYSIGNENSIIQIEEGMITAVPDPATISISGVVIGLTSTDILMHTQKNILAHATIHTDRFSRTAREMLSQRNFYPLYPPNENVPMDIDLWTKYAQMECTPHILLLPSDLNHFIKQVDKTTVINPGRLSSGKRTYARLQIDVPDESVGLVDVADIMMGEIVKI
jgi:DNA polymerase alpha subunit B